MAIQIYQKREIIFSYTDKMTICDTDIIDTMGRNVEAGFKLLLRRYKEPVYWHIRRLVVSHDDALDAMQETFVRIYKSYTSIKSPNAFKAWIYRIATNEALRFRDSRKVALLNIDDETVDKSKMLASTYINFNDLEAVKLQQAILSLPTKQQLIFNLKYYDDLSYDEIAKITGSLAVNVKVNYHIAKNRIIKYLNE